jgi:RNA polymerase sigma-70 factor, ECF subfamily
MRSSLAASIPATTPEPLSLEEIYREHSELVKRWAVRLGGPGIDVEDIVHEVFIVAQKKLGQFRGDAKLTTWLYRITERVAYKQVRRQRLGRWLHGHAGDFAGHLAAEEGCPHGEMERQQASALVYEALEGLGHKHRTAVILYEIEGLSGEEIAELMDTKLPTVWVWLHRGRGQFLERLRELVARRPAA